MVSESSLVGKILSTEVALAVQTLTTGKLSLLEIVREVTDDNINAVRVRA